MATRSLQVWGFLRPGGLVRFAVCAIDRRGRPYARLSGFFDTEDVACAAAREIAARKSNWFFLFSVVPADDGSFVAEFDLPFDWQ